MLATYISSRSTLSGSLKEYGHSPNVKCQFLTIFQFRTNFSQSYTDITYISLQTGLCKGVIGSQRLRTHGKHLFGWCDYNYYLNLVIRRSQHLLPSSKGKMSAFQFDVSNNAFEIMWNNSCDDFFATSMTVRWLLKPVWPTRIYTIFFTSGLCGFDLFLLTH